MTDMQTAHESASRWERRKERTHRRLLEAADVLFLEKGFEATTVEEVAAMADVAKGTFFNYFESKEALLVALLSQHINRVLEDVPGVGQPAPVRVRLLLAQIWTVFRPYLHLIHRLFAYNMARPVDQRTPPISLAVSQLLREGQAQGLVRAEVDVEIAGVFIVMYFFRVCMSGCTGPAAADRVMDAPTVEEWTRLIEKGLDIIEHGILAPAAQAGSLALQDPHTFPLSR